jgi:carboxymethylenebutenolidase
VVADTTPLSIHRPSGTPRGGLVVIQEAFGVNEHIEAVCRRFAAEGWFAVAPHLFHRSGDPVFAYDDLDGARAVAFTLDLDGVLSDVDAAFDAIADSGIPRARTGIVGYCMGGSVALVVAARRDVGAAVTYYGGGIRQARGAYPPLLDEAPKLRAPWLGLYGDLDQGIPVDEVEELRTAAATSGRETDVVRYPDAGHGFNCDPRPGSYHEASSVDGWKRTLDWFGRHLGGA